MPSKKKCKLFISYSRHDEHLVKPLAALLGVASNDSVFMDVDRLKPGNQWERKLIEAIEASQVFILCWCCGSQQSHFVAKEILTASADTQKELVPVLFCSAPLPQDLRSRQWIDLRRKVNHRCVRFHSLQPLSTAISAVTAETMSLCRAALSWLWSFLKPLPWKRIAFTILLTACVAYARHHFAQSEVIVRMAEVFYAGIMLGIWVVLPILGSVKFMYRVPGRGILAMPEDGQFVAIYDVDSTEVSQIAEISRNYFQNLRS